jgi:hypothetical protein
MRPGPRRQQHQRLGDRTGRKGGAEAQSEAACALAAADLLDGRLAVERRPDRGTQQPVSGRPPIFEPATPPGKAV